jgi:ring-1,2-phenylacetyl-CoA epoxidase subunit PaaE
MRFHPLRIAHLARETRDAVALEFDVPPSLRESFRHEAGQHVTVKAQVGGEDLRRSYSICTPAGDGRLRIAIKRDPGGAFSTWANESLAAGDTLEITPPMGHFGPAIEREAHHHYVAFAAGSGITPILSIVASILDGEPQSHVTLFYGNRASASVMFREELAALKDRHLQRFNLVHVLSREAQDIDLLHGRIDRERAGALVDRWVPLAEVDAVYVCGPEGMMDAVRDAMLERGVAPERIRIERFASSIPKRGPRPPRTVASGRSDTEVTVVQDGIRKTYVLDRAKDSLLDGALAAGIELPYSCKGGVCSTCRCRLVEGEVDMDVNFALEDYEVARGFRLACQSFAASDKVVVDFDQTGMG